MTKTFYPKLAVIVGVISFVYFNGIKLLPKKPIKSSLEKYYTLHNNNNNNNLIKL
jgi:hypothetical protein